MVSRAWIAGPLAGLVLAVALAGLPNAVEASPPYGGLLSEGENGIVIFPGPTDSKGDEIPMESMSLNFGTILFTFKEQNEKSTAKSGVPMTWDVSENAGKK
jgi:hypothetical protein